LAQNPSEAPALARSESSGGRVTLGTLLSWALPVFALSSPLFFIQFFFLKFSTDVLLLPPLVVGLLFASGRAWDAISDPIVGTWSDRTRTRLGRRRPWMLAGVPLLAVAILMVWIPPASLEGGALIGWVAVSLFFFYTAFTTYIVPHSALGAELSTDHHDRSRIFGVQNASFTLGMMMAFAGMQYVTLAEDPRAAMRLLVSIGVVVMVVILLVPPLRVHERAEYQGRGGDNPMRAMRDVVQNVHARRLLFAQGVQMLGASVLGILSPYLFEYILKRPGLIGPLPAVFVVCSIASIPFWVRMSRRFGKRETWMSAMVLAGLAFGSGFFLGENDVGGAVVLMVVAGFALGCGGSVGPSILADVIDDDELRTGERKEGAYNASWGFAIKTSNAFVILVTGVALQLSDFTPNVEQSAETKLMLRLLYAVLPLTMFLTAAWVLRGFKLDATEHARIRAELDRRNA